MSSRTCALAVFLALAAPGAAGADATDDAAAERLLAEGVELARTGDFAGACERFSAAVRLRADVRGKGLEAGCYEKLGRLATAWRAYGELRALAEAAGDADAASFAAAGTARLAPRLARGRIEIAGEAAAPHLALTLDGEELALDAARAGVPVDAGVHEVRLQAPGHAPVLERFEIADGELRRLWFPALAPTAAPPAPVPASPPRRARSRRAAAGLVTLGAAGGLLVVGGWLGLAAIDDWGAARDAGCSDDGRCPDGEALAHARVAAREADASTILVGAGLAAAAVGAWLWLGAEERAGAPAERAPARAASWRLDPWFTSDGGGLAVTILRP